MFRGYCFCEYYFVNKIEEEVHNNVQNGQICTYFKMCLGICKAFHRDSGKGSLKRPHYSYMSSEMTLPTVIFFNSGGRRVVFTILSRPQKISTCGIIYYVLWVNKCSSKKCF